ncbi:MFS transporter [Deinococcus sp. SL84]|uniref:MFS transporter n=1 Tax=Deinococcus sp. SL84 TaxID=2994663 RepID=UPI0022757FDE|nr:MFS transporter [Deinococcus sp. SL84]MCY1703307.1 MFS transporter [Deinococcus sp. SL84]
MLWKNPALMLRLLALLILSEAAHFGFFITALPLRAESLSLNAALIGTLTGGHYLADALSKGPMGYLAGRWGAGLLLALASLAGLLVLGTVTVGHLPYLALFALAAVWGVLYGSLWPVVMGYSQLLAEPGRTSRALALTSLAVAPGLALGVGVLGPLMQRQPQQGLDLLLGLQGLALLLSLTLLRLKPAPQTGNRAASLGELRRQWSGVALLLPAALAQTLAPGLLVTLVFPLLAQFGLGMMDLAWPALGLLVGLGLTLWLAGRLADRTSPRRALLPGLLVLALSYGLLALPHPEDRLWLALPLLGVGYGAFLTGWNGLVGQVLPQGQRMTGWGAIMTVEALGYAAGPVLGGLMWTHYGHSGVFATGAAVFVTTLVYYLWAAGQAQPTRSTVYSESARP